MNNFTPTELKFIIKAMMTKCKLPEVKKDELRSRIGDHILLKLDREYEKCFDDTRPGDLSCDIEPLNHAYGDNRHKVIHKGRVISIHKDFYNAQKGVERFYKINSPCYNGL